MNNQVIKLRANSNHFGHPVTSSDHPAPPVTGKQKSRASAKRRAAEPEKSMNVQFSLHHSSAKKVWLVGEFTQWDAKPVPMTANQAGEWHATIALRPGRYRYRYVVDGEWQDDPNATERLPNPFGSCDCVAEVG